MNESQDQSSLNPESGLSTSPSKCFVLAADRNQGDFLCWMLDQLKDSEFPILVYDLGMDSLHWNIAQLLINGGELIEYDPSYPHEMKAWFYKPDIIRSAHYRGYDIVCWLDNDLEIVGDIEDIFDHAEMNKICLAKDWAAEGNSLIEVWNSGVILSWEACDALGKWDHEVKSRIHRGDQEALAMMQHTGNSFRYSIEDLPNKYNWQRLQKKHLDPIPDIRMIHWTGPVGKEHIRARHSDYWQRTFA